MKYFTKTFQKIFILIFLLLNCEKDWDPVVSPIPFKKVGFDKISVASLSIDSNGTIFAGLVAESVYISKDNGETWSSINSPIRATYAIEVVTDDSIYFGGSGLYIFLKQQIWRTIYTSLFIHSIARDQKGGIYIGTDFDGIIFKNTIKQESRNLGLSDVPVNDIKVLENRLFACNINGLFYLDTLGHQWKKTSLQQEVYSIAINSSNFIFAGTSEGLYVSDDAGLSWQFISYDFQVQDIRVIKIDVDDNIIVGTNGGGVYLSTTNGTSWMKISSGLQQKKIISMAFSPEKILYVGIEYGGMYKGKYY